ncbi:unnamed protein product [Fusarium graminearum]|nr:unnamed protein product [Fusarium graminearum]CAG1960015.1 unnamed protein product [Fusarium graminearum]VTO84323.1 unnamed protein product [Fusarium graminearum]
MAVYEKFGDLELEFLRMRQWQWQKDELYERKVEEKEEEVFVSDKLRGDEARLEDTTGQDKTV